MHVPLTELIKTSVKSKVLDNVESTARDHLANERTFLSWIRTSFGCLALGVLIARLHFQYDPQIAGKVSSSQVLSAITIIISICCIFIGLWRYSVVKYWLEENKFETAGYSIIFTMISVLAISITSLVLILVSY
jgi:uncharacterized membrane protein YidH (DUF202 family)